MIVKRNRHWSDYKITPHKKNEDINNIACKKVYLYDKNKKFIKKLPSLTICAKELNTTGPTIKNKIIKGVFFKDYYLSFEKPYKKPFKNNFI